MNRRHQGHALIDELLTDPAIFRQSGQGYRLLKQYFSDLPIETLRSLINSDNYDVRYVAIGIAEELGEKSSILLDDVICLFDSGDRYAKYNILEIIVVCARGEYQDRFIHLARGLDDSDDVIRTLAMRLMSRADLAQLRAAARTSERVSNLSKEHQRGLSELALGEHSDPQTIRKMLLQDVLITKIYGVIAAKRLRRIYPELIEIVSGLPDNLFREFAK